MLNRLFVAVILAAALTVPAVADDVITLELETPGFEATAPQPEAKQPPTNVTTVTGKAAKTPIGRVALVSSERAGIHARQSSRSRVYSVCVKDTPIAVVAQSRGWYGVLMIDGSMGWIESSKIRLLDYGVIPRSGRYASRGGYDRGEAGDLNPSGSAVIQTALQYLGVPYVYGGNNAYGGIDCSAFLKAVYSQYGVNLPRTANAQANVGAPVASDDLQPGDRLYFACRHSYVDHCGIYMGNGYFIHASASRGGVGVDRLTTPMYYRSLVCAMR